MVHSNSERRSPKKPAILRSDARTALRLKQSQWDSPKWFAIKNLQALNCSVIPVLPMPPPDLKRTTRSNETFHPAQFGIPPGLQMPAQRTPASEMNEIANGFLFATFSCRVNGQGKWVAGIGKLFPALCGGKPSNSTSSGRSADFNGKRNWAIVEGLCQALARAQGRAKRTSARR